MKSGEGGVWKGEEVPWRETGVYNPCTAHVSRIIAYTRTCSVTQPTRWPCRPHFAGPGYVCEDSVVDPSIRLVAGQFSISAGTKPGCRPSHFMRDGARYRQIGKAYD